MIGAADGFNSRQIKLLPADRLQNMLLAPQFQKSHARLRRLNGLDIVLGDVFP